MKNIKTLLVLIIGVLSFSMSAQIKETAIISSESLVPAMTFEKVEHDFGTINEGDKVETTFNFTNTGDAPLIITQIRASCGCTIPSGWKRAPILPGEKGQFLVKFNSKNKPNAQHKRITITCNTAKKREHVKIKAQVIPNPELAKKRALNRERSKLLNAQRRAAKAAKESKSPVFEVDRKGFSTPKLKKGNTPKKQFKKTATQKRKEEEDAQKKEVTKTKRKIAKEDLKIIKLKRKQLKKELKRKERANKKELKRLKKERKQADKKRKKAEKKAKEIERLTDKIASKQKRINKYEAKILKREHKLNKALKRGKLSPDEKFKKERKIQDIKNDLEEAKLDIAHLKSKLELLQ